MWFIFYIIVIVRWSAASAASDFFNHFLLRGVFLKKKHCDLERYITLHGA